MLIPEREVSESSMKALSQETDSIDAIGCQTGIAQKIVEQVGSGKFPLLVAE